MSFTLLRRPRPGSHRVSVTDGSASPPLAPHLRQFPGARIHATADFTEADDDEDEDEDEDEDQQDDTLRLQSGLGRLGYDGGSDNVPLAGQDRGQDRDENDDIDDGDDGEGNGDQSGDGQDSAKRRPPLPVLPLFSSTHLDTLPVYSMTHAIRIIVSARTETTLTWDQLRSPQVSQFLIKPMQQQIRAQHFSRATLYALMANCLQFTKEGQRNAANAGTSNTRARVCELLALKMLKEYSTRELIDALAYDFYPLQGMPGVQPPPTSGSSGSRSKNTVLMASRTSTLEVAIRASAKHFLAHPVIVQQLEAIWNGAITFYSSADSLHRDTPSERFGPGHPEYTKVGDRTPLLGSLPPKHGHFVPPGRRTVMLYDPRQASLLKLSRLRVPRYRSFLSTLSLAVLVGLFLAVLTTRSVQITALELIFWFWSAGFMLDELVGFNEQGFALYIMSFWNIFDLGILVLLIVYYCMRIYGVFLADPHHSNAMAYDVLAANAILLLPRIFSVLDHYQYFSQLFIAFRLMAADLAAVCVLIFIVCSGFFVFFTSSQTSADGSDIAYRIFQIFMGFTPAAWELWPSYNWLARLLMCLFLIICHFLVVTILITVLSNSFMTIASNANEEHQFLFAINTISMVKNDALFSYVAPSNIFAWLLMPLRYCMPLKQFVYLNRIIIKVTHCPILFCIYLYERFWLAPSVYEPTDLVENHGRGRSRTISFVDAVNRMGMFSPSMRVREESVAGYHKDRALDELFLRQPDAATLRTQRRNERRKTKTAIRNWMDQNDADGISGNWSTMDSRGVPDWQRRMSVGWDRRMNPRRVSDARSIVSDPADITSNAGLSFGPPRPEGFRPGAAVPEYRDHTDADGDDEFVTNDEDEEMVSNANLGQPEGIMSTGDGCEDYFTTTTSTGGRTTKRVSSHGSSGEMKSVTRAPAGKLAMHSRVVSTNTILCNAQPYGSGSVSPSKPLALPNRSAVAIATAGGETSTQGGRRSDFAHIAKPRPIASLTQATPGGSTRTVTLSSMAPLGRDQASSADPSIFSDNTISMLVEGDANAGLAGSFQTQMAMALMKNNRLQGGEAVDSADRDRMGRLVLAKMKTLEESFAEVIKEMRDLKNSSTVPTTRRNSSVEEYRPGSSLEMARERLSDKRKVMKRPGSGRSMGPTEDKGKGKYVYSAEEKQGRGSSM